MLFNCLHCCKAISSRNEYCPYCRIEIMNMVEKMDISRKAEPAPVVTQAERDKKSRQSGKLVYSAMASISQIIHVMRAPKTKTSHR